MGRSLCEGIDFQNLAIEYLFRGADVPDACQKFVKVIASAGALQKIVVHGKALDKVLAQYLRGPDTELYATVGIDPVADTDDYIEVVVCYVSFYFPVSLVLNCCKKCNSSIRIQFPRFKDIADMP